jgi:hypothetical protein
MPKSVYRLIADQLEKKGLRATMMRPHQLVFSPPSHMGGGWLTYYKEKWYLATWAPRLYQIGERKNLVPLCNDFLNIGKSSASLSPEIISKYKLQALSDSEMEDMFSDQDKTLG